MRGLVSGIFTKGSKDNKLEVKEIPALRAEQSPENNFYLKTIWGRQVLAVEKKDGGILITPDLCGELPVYAYTVHNKLYMASNFEDLINLIPNDKLPEVDKSNMLRSLVMEDNENGETILKNVLVANGDNLLFWDGEKLQIIKYFFKQEKIKPGLTFEYVLQNRLSWAKNFKDDEIGVTLSGGVDSAVIWAGLISMGIKPVAFSIIFPGENGETQSDKISEIIRKDKTNWVRVSGKNFKFRETKDFAYYRDIYAPLVEALTVRARESGIKVMLTGYGGDEISRNAGYKFEGGTVTERKIPGYITKKAITDWEKLGPEGETPPGLIPDSVFSATRACGMIWQERGIWMENIFSYPVFWQWSQQQKPEWGLDKKGFRDLLMNSGITKIAGSVTRENFREVYLSGIKDWAAKGLEEVAENSILTKWGWLDKYKLLAMREMTPEYNVNAKYLYGVYRLESFLQTYYKQKGSET